MGNHHTMQPADGIIRGAYGSRGIPAMPAEKKISGVGGFEAE